MTWAIALWRDGEIASVVEKVNGSSTREKVNRQMATKPSARWIGLAGLVLLMDGCMVGPAYHTPTVTTPPDGLTIMVFMPISRPALSSSGPPELPGLIGALVWMAP